MMQKVNIGAGTKIFINGEEFNKGVREIEVAITPKDLPLITMRIVAESVNVVDDEHGRRIEIKTR